ncbi:hypothetical protein ACOQFV_24955 [Nocardiopsis changdeensis]|uniref:Uncharacterized protein n=1 Tax=Nocardiopsis changdeensis TaxID=2831969 RepID=A0ABX8BQY0_9ACTN|nr:MULTISPECIES: hypothetical protein [Nocardiopsis]QUX24635.1 hypothetical protein KGD84_10420 [Nocardiopsis changdeensis]QYX35024.1 hypothetical protein K1J57_19875 [Nocardiopsis sp. MT53]
MEALGVPWFMSVRLLGPPLLLLVVGGALLLWRRPGRSKAVWAALAVNLLAAALPFLWIGVQAVTDQAERTVYGLVMTLLQPSVSLVAWGLLLWAAVFPARAPDGAAAAREGGRPEHESQNIG